MSSGSTRRWFGPEVGFEVPATDIVSYVFGRLSEIDPQKSIYVDAQNPECVITAGDALRLVNQLISAFKSLGIQDGQCVCIHAPNNIAYPLIWLAVVGSGGCVTGSNPAYTTDEVLHHFRITDPCFVVTQAECLTALEGAAQVYGLPLDRILQVRPTDICCTFGIQTWIPHEDFLPTDDNVAQWRRLKTADQANTIALLASTSGSTGLPKCAEISHKALVAQCEMINLEGTVHINELSQLICLPIFHAFAGPLAILLPLRLGITTYFLPRFRLDNFVDSVERFSITHTPVVPAIVGALLSSSELNRLRSLRHVICAGSPMSAIVQQKLSDALHPKANVAQLWGLTETGWVSTFHPAEKDKTGSVGRLLPNVELAIEKDGVLIREEGTAGEALVRSSGLFSGYRGKTASESSDNHGFFRTGDLVYISDRKVYVQGRLKDTFKVKGWQVSPWELENILLQHPDVLDAAVTGRQCAAGNGLEDLKPVAFVVLKDPWIHLKPKLVVQIQAFVDSRVVSYKNLKGGIIVVDNIPRGHTGKILRNELQSLHIV